MNHLLTIDTQQLIDNVKIEEFQQTLEAIEQKLDEEVVAKQKTIERQEQEIQRLHKVVEEKNSIIISLNEKLIEHMKINEGNRQLTNKLVNDIDRLNRDIEWYKKTFEVRSFLGVIRQKFTKK